jgi:hypothetical protein
MATFETLAVALDASGMEKGATQVKTVTDKALTNVKELTTGVAQLETQMTSFGQEVGDRVVAKLDRLDTGISNLNDNLGYIANRMKAAEAEVSRLKDAQDKATASTTKQGEATKFLDSIMDRTTQKFALLGKAAVGLFTADIVAKVLGFNSAMELVQKAADQTATALRAMFGFDAEWERNQRHAQRYADALKEAREHLEAMTLRPEALSSFGTTFNPDLSQYADNPDRKRQAVLEAEKVRDAIKANAAEYNVKLNDPSLGYSTNLKAYQALVAEYKENAQDLIADFDSRLRRGVLTADERWNARMEELHTERMKRIEEEHAAIDAQTKDELKGIESKLDRLKAEEEASLKTAGAVAILADRRKKARMEDAFGQLAEFSAGLGYSAAKFQGQQQFRTQSELLRRDAASEERMKQGYTPFAQLQVMSGRYAYDQDFAQREEQSIRESVGDADMDKLLKMVDEQDRIREIIGELESGAVRAARAAKDMGNAFGEALERAVFSGEKLHNVLGALILDLAKMAFRQAVTAPFAQGITNFFSGAFGVGNTAPGVGGGLDLPGAGNIPGHAMGGRIYEPHYLVPARGRGPVRRVGEAGTEDITPVRAQGRPRRGGGDTVVIQVGTGGAGDGIRRTARQVADDVRKGRRR